MARPGLTQHRKFRRLERALGSHIIARGALETLWDVSYQNGDPFLGDSDDVEAAAHWDGESGKLTKALLEAGGGAGAGFIEEIPGSPRQFQVHDLYHHAPDYVRKRRTREDARRAKTDPVPTPATQTADSDRSATGQWQATPDSQTGVDVTCAPAPAPLKESISSNAEASDGSHSRDGELQDALRQVWEYYLTATSRNPKTYDFTPTRKRVGLARLRDCIRKTGNDIEKAVALMRLAVDGIVASDWHMGRNPKSCGRRYCDWQKNLFKNLEQMEEWWNSEAIPAPSGANGHVGLSSNREAC